MTSQTMKFETPDHGEETARADLYGLLANLFYAPPSKRLLETIAATKTAGEGILHHAWSKLVSACATTNAEAVREEYEQLFIGVSKPEVMLYGSYYLSGFLMEKPLAILRSDLAELNLERTPEMVESEDHIAALCEVMRYLIAADDVVHAHIAQQKKFFGNHLQPWVENLWIALEAHPQAKFYRVVGHLAHEFFNVEMQAFDMT